MCVIERLRLAECPAVEVSLTIEAPIGAVWDVMTDISVPAAIGEELQQAEWLTGPIGLGATFQGTNLRKGRTWTTTCTVIDYEPPRRFGWAVEDIADPAATWTLVATDHGTHTGLMYRMQLGPGPSGLADAIARHPDREDEIIAARIAEQTPRMRQVLEAIRERSERA